MSETFKVGEQMQRRIWKKGTRDLGIAYWVPCTLFEVVPAATFPQTYDHPGVRNAWKARNHVSYVVKDRSGKPYWPRAGWLRKEGK